MQVLETEQKILTFIKVNKQLVNISGIERAAGLQPSFIAKKLINQGREYWMAYEKEQVLKVLSDLKEDITALQRAVK